MSPEKDRRDGSTLSDGLDRTLVVVGHPDLSQSRISSALIASVDGLPAVSVRRLSEHISCGGFDVSAEQRAVEEVDHLVLQYPTYWYAPPALLKLWLDTVMTAPWAYRRGGPGVLVGKTLRVVTSTGGVVDAYHEGAFHGWEYDTVLTPLKATARRLGMTWLDPIVIHGSRDISHDQLTALGEEYRRVLRGGATEPMADPAA